MGKTTFCDLFNSASARLKTWALSLWQSGAEGTDPGNSQSSALWFSQGKGNSWTFPSCCCCLVTDALSTSWAWNGSRAEIRNGISTHIFLARLLCVSSWSCGSWGRLGWFPCAVAAKGDVLRSALSPHYPTSSLHPQPCNHFKDIFTRQRQHIRKSK